MARVVATTEPAVDESPTSDRWGVPPSLETMLAPLATWRKPAAGSGGRRATLDGVPIALGRPVALTIDPDLQALAQKTAACYTGRHDVCRALGIARTADAGRPPGTGLLEGAMVRMAAVAIVDVPSGRIEALAGARTPCARQEVDGPGRDPSCDTRLPWPVRFRPDALLNPAVFHDAMPASTIKPVLAAALLADGESGTRLLAAERAAAANERGGTPSRGGLRGELVRSDSARFLDRLFCADRAFAADCVRPWRVAEMATAFGWNAGCNAPSDGRGRGAGTGREAVPGDGPRDPGPAGACGRRDLLTGGTDVGEASGDRLPRRPVSFGRLMVEPRDGALRPFAPTRLDGGIVARCAAGADGRRGSNDDWEKCRGGRVVDVVAEGWGQGHARASALGVAGMMAALAAAADGRAAPAPHLVRAGPWSDAAAATTASPSVPPRRLPPSCRRSPGRTARAPPAAPARRSSARPGARRSRGSPARPARRASPATASRSTPSPRCAATARPSAACRAAIPTAPSGGGAPAVRCVPTSGTSRPGARAALRTRPGARPSPCSSSAIGRRRRASSRASATTARTRRPRSRCRSPAASSAGCPAPRRDGGPCHGDGGRRRTRGASMSAALASRRPARAGTRAALPEPLVWTFDGPLERALDDLEHTLRRALVMVGDVQRIALLVDISLPALAARVRAGDALQPTWSRFVERLGACGIPGTPRIRHLKDAGPLATLVVAYRS
jgi:hypothetical protein